MQIDIEDQGATQFDVVARQGPMVLGKLEAGFVGDVLDWESADSKNRFWIGNLYVEPAHRRNGVGRALVDAAKAEGKRRWGVDAVYARIGAMDAMPEVEILAFHLAVDLHPVGQIDYADKQATVTRGSL